jgi:serine/threonine protein kinase
MLRNDMNDGEKRDILPEEDCKKIFRQLVDAVSYCHRHGIAHLDIKVDNFLVDSNLNVKLLDFGLSELVNNGELCERFCGSKEYLAPEIMARKPYDPMKADVWNLGNVLYILYTFQFPYDYKERKRIWEEDGVHQPSAVSGSSIPALAKNLISNMMKISPSERFTIDDVLNHPYLC